MSGVPTLQSLALYAREHFGEDGDPFTDSIPSSLDVIVRVYAREADPERVQACSCAVLRQWLQSRRRTVDQAGTDEFVRWAIKYLQAVYPDAERVQEKAEQRLLSHLFWGHLVEARRAAAGCASGTGLEWVSRQEQRMPVLV